jgi:hypothetical protein
MNLLQSTLVKISDISFNTGQIPDVPKNPRLTTSIILITK